MCQTFELSSCVMANTHLNVLNRFNKGGIQTYHVAEAKFRAFGRVALAFKMHAWSYK